MILLTRFRSLAHKRDFMGNDKKRNFLFFFVHPSKYYLFRNTINYLKQEGHNVDIAIIKKDVLEDLVKQEGWEYTNLFPKGRRSTKTNRLTIFLATVINFIKTVWRLHKLTAKKRYDIYVTDDCLTITGFYRKVPSYIFCDDDINVIKEISLLFKTATYIISPECTNLGSFNNKKIGFKGYKASSYLHPDVFVPQKEVLKKYDLCNKTFFIIRLVALTASHDAGKKGISNDDLCKVIELLNTKGTVVLSSERELPSNIEKYRKKICPEDILHLINYANLFISDSQTMSMEAGYLGTPFIRYNDFIGQISCLEEIENKYKLGFGVLIKDKELFFLRIKEITDTPDIKKIWLKRRQRVIDETINLNTFLIDLFNS